MNSGDIKLAKAIAAYCGASLTAIVLVVVLGYAQASDEADAAQLNAQQRAIAMWGASK
jgi:hypothetical protein